MAKANKNVRSKIYFIDTFEGFIKTSGEHKKDKTFVYEKTDELKTSPRIIISSLEKYLFWLIAIKKTAKANGPLIRKAVIALFIKSLDI